MQPIAELAGIAHERGAVFHTDAVQAVGTLPIDVEANWASTCCRFRPTSSTAPRASALLYVRRGTPFIPVLHRRRSGARPAGGHRERRRHRRSGGGPDAGAGAPGAGERPPDCAARPTDRRRARDGAGRALSGHPTQRLPNSANFVVEYVEGESMLLSLDMAGIAASSGSACTSGSLEPSHVLRPWACRCGGGARLAAPHPGAGQHRRGRRLRVLDVCPRSSSGCGRCRRCIQ